MHIVIPKEAFRRKDVQGITISLGLRCPSQLLRTASGRRCPLKQPPHISTEKAPESSFLETLSEFSNPGVYRISSHKGRGYPTNRCRERDISILHQKTKQVSTVHVAWGHS
ncbi:epididymis-specific alpha-mannosidase [Platysternon megacephalum]|uniref:Epididymis-specific alpha-mannosidase n=1 Tax=Platysternon megacephalum TaxID=55544 RepID=A0A4D9EX66_9SAUR|nr:epididymis-specific alpha-mannosidase [Platysternon megacephalum]